MTDEAAGVMTGYLETMSTVWLAEHVSLVDARTGRAYAGRSGATEWLHWARLAGAQARDIHMLVSGAYVAAEWVLRPHDGGTVRMAAFALVEVGEIAALRIYRGGSAAERDRRPIRSPVGRGKDR